MPKPQFTLYTPVDFDPKKHRSVDNYHGRHELQWQGKYADEGIIIVRFELPYKVFCTGCNEYISMGNRYDAEKKVIGKYHSMNIYKFTMLCHVCITKWEMRTDPETLDYVCMSGCRRKTETWDSREANGITMVDSEVRKKLLGDKMFTKEFKDDDKRKQFHITDEIKFTEVDRYARKYDFDLNQQLRKSFKKKKLELNEEEKEKENTKLKHGMKGGDLKLLKPDASDAENSKKLVGKLLKNRPKPLTGLDSLKKTLKVDKKPSCFSLKQKQQKAAALSLVQKNNLRNDPQKDSIFHNAHLRRLSIGGGSSSVASSIKSSSSIRSKSSSSSSLIAKQNLVKSGKAKKRRSKSGNDVIVID